MTTRLCKWTSRNFLAGCLSRVTATTDQRPHISDHNLGMKETDYMTILRIGTNEKYADGWAATLASPPARRAKGQEKVNRQEEDGSKKQRAVTKGVTAKKKPATKNEAGDEEEAGSKRRR